MTISFGQNAQKLIRTIVSKLQTIDLKIYEEASYEYINNKVLVELNKIFTEWYLLLTSMLSYYEKLAQENSHKFSASLENSDSSAKTDILEVEDTTPLGKLVNTITLAKWEYEWKKRSLKEQDLKEQDPLDLLLLISRLYRSILKTSQAIEQALCVYERLDYDSLFIRVSKVQLEISLEIRRIYSRFIQVVSEEKFDSNIEINEQVIKEKLRRIGAAIAVIHGRTIFSHIRVSDRVLIKQLQNRIVTWLSSTPLKVEIGKTIWQDVCSFAELLVEINNRAELIQHDTSVLSYVYSELVRLPDFIKPLSPNLFIQIKATIGRSNQLDKLIQDYRDASIGQWKKAISNALEQMGTNKETLCT